MEENTIIKEVENKSFTYKNEWDDEYRLVPILHHYANNNHIGIELFDLADYETYCYLTTNIDSPLTNEIAGAFVNINNFSDALKVIRKEKLGIVTNNIGYSGYCAYPEVEFDLNKLVDHSDFQKYIEEKEKSLEEEMG